MKKWLIIIPICFYTNQLRATPVVNSVTGTIATGQTVTVSGTGFDAKPMGNNKPIIYWDSLGGSVNTDLSISSNSWTRLQNAVMDTSGTNDRQSGVLPSVTNWTHTSPVVYNFGFAGHGSGGKYRMGMYRKSSYTIYYATENVKIWRVWAHNIDTESGNNEYADWYTAHNNGDPSPTECVDDTEALTASPTSNHEKFFTCTLLSSSWRWEDWVAQTSTIDVANGYRQWTINGSVALTYPTWMSSQNVALSQNTPDIDFDFQDDIANPRNTDPNGLAWRDVMYLDYGWNAAFICDAATYSSCTHFEYQPYTSWAGTGITLSFRAGSYAPGSNVYLYVLDNSNVPNTSGYSLTIGGTPPPPPPPSASGAVCPCTKH